jgi:hypothetical protein
MPIVHSSMARRAWALATGNSRLAIPCRRITLRPSKNAVPGNGLFSLFLRKTVRPIKGAERW